MLTGKKGGDRKGLTVRDVGGAEPKIAKYMRCTGRKAKVKAHETTEGQL